MKKDTKRLDCARPRRHYGVQLLVVGLCISAMLALFRESRRKYMWNCPSANQEELSRFQQPTFGDVTIVHLSDTHCHHRDISLPEGDLLVHTGDFSNSGSDAEFKSFNRWLGDIKHKYRYGVYVVLGNHDYKFLNGVTADDELIAILASDDNRRVYMQERLSNCVVLDNEIHQVKISSDEKDGLDLSLTLFGSPWNPFQSSPTHPDRVATEATTAMTDHDRVFYAWSASLPDQRKNQWPKGRAWRYDEIPSNVDILLTHVPPFGVLDRQPMLTNWGSSAPLLDALKRKRPRAHLFGHVHAQRGYWESTFTNDTRAENDNGIRIIGGVQYAKSTNDQEAKDLMRTGDGKSGVQFLANTALMSDRTVQPFAKKKIVGQPRVIRGKWIPKAKGAHSYWNFHDISSTLPC